MNGINMAELAGMVAETKVINAEAGQVDMTEVRRRFAKRLTACRNAYNSLNNFARENWAFLCSNAVTLSRDKGLGRYEVAMGAAHYDDYQYQYDLIFQSTDKGQTYNIDDETGLHVNNDNRAIAHCEGYIYPRISIRKISSPEAFVSRLEPSGVKEMEENVCNTERFYCDTLPTLFRVLLEHCRDNAKNNRDTLRKAEGTDMTDGRRGEIKKVTICVETVCL